MTDFSSTSNLPDFKINDESKLVLKDILRSKDRENKGYVDIDELGDCLEAFGFNPDDEDLDFLKIHMDDNGDGKLEVEEVLENIEVINYHCWYGKILMDEFTYIDADKDGVIRFPEMLRVLTNRGQLEVVEARKLLDSLARKFDANFDGKFSYPEFVKIYMSDLLPFKDQIESGSYERTSKESAHTTNQQTGTPKTAKKKKLVRKKESQASLIGAIESHDQHSNTNHQNHSNSKTTTGSNNRSFANYDSRIDSPKLQKSASSSVAKSGRISSSATPNYLRTTAAASGHHHKHQAPVGISSSTRPKSTCRPKTTGKSKGVNPANSSTVNSTNSAAKSKTHAENHKR